MKMYFPKWDCACQYPGVDDSLVAVPEQGGLLTTGEDTSEAGYEIDMGPQWQAIGCTAASN